MYRLLCSCMLVKPKSPKKVQIYRTSFRVGTLNGNLQSFFINST